MPSVMFKQCQRGCPECANGTVGTAGCTVPRFALSATSGRKWRAVASRVLAASPGRCIFRRETADSACRTHRAACGLHQYAREPPRRAVAAGVHSGRRAVGAGVAARCKAGEEDASGPVAIVHDNPRSVHFPQGNSNFWDAPNNDNGCAQSLLAELFLNGTNGTV